MMRARMTVELVLWIGLAVLITPGCASESGLAAEEAAAGAQTAKEQDGVEEELPAGHPPVTTAPQGMDLPPVPSGAGMGAEGLTWKVPEGWQVMEPSSAVRRAQYRVSGDAGDGECVVYYFGPGQGGDPEANAMRWADQFRQPDLRPSREVLETEEIEVNGLRVLTARVTGIYNAGTMSGVSSQTRPGYMLIGAIAQGPDANWFFKLTGPEATVRENEEAFGVMIRSLR